MEIVDVGSLRGEDLVAVGKVTKAHGIKGEIKIFPFSGVPEDFQDYDELLFLDEHGSPVRAYALAETRGQGRLVIARLAGLGDRNESESLLGLEICVRRDCLPELEPGFYYWHDLEGMAVVTDEGVAVGSVASLLDTPAHPILVIKDKGREHLIPAIGQFVADVDIEARVLRISPPPGLLELNA